MTLNDELQDVWADHGARPEDVAERLMAMVPRAGVEDLPYLAGLVVHVFGEHLARWEQGIAIVHELMPRADNDVAAIQALQRASATLRMCAGDSTEVEVLLARFGAERPGHEARVLAAAAAAAGAQGRTSDAARWLVRAAALAYALPDSHAAVRAVATTGNNLAVVLEERPSLGADEASLLRSAAQLARVAWERAGTWREVERAEYRLTRTSLVLGESYAAVAHAEACMAICLANQADPLELFFANEARARAMHAFGALGPSRAARAAVAALVGRVEPDMAGLAADALAKLDLALES